MAPEIQGDWDFGKDNSQNRLGIARTGTPNVFALHNTADPSQAITVTRGQLNGLAHGIKEEHYPTLAP